MDPKTYCMQMLQAMTKESDSGGDFVDRTQVRLLLAHYARHTPPELDFARDLNALVRRAELAGQHTLARAARQILKEWQARARAVAAS